jgi:hypothetical protein
MLAITTVTLEGTTLANADVIADVTIRHGRTGYFDAPSPSTCQITILDTNRSVTRAVRLGRELVINATDGSTVAPRFVGRTTDANLDDGDLTIIAVGYLSTLSGYTVGAVDYPQETWTARVTRAFTDAGLASSLVVQTPNPNPLLWARPANPVALDGYLAELVDAIGGAVADLPDGRILVQPISWRTLDAPVYLDPATVAYAPQWISQLPGVNQLTVSYGDPDAPSTLYRTDAASVDLYGPRPASISTPVVDALVAGALADALIARQAYARWTTPATELLQGRRLAIGVPVNVHHLPASAPNDPWYPILEGWQDRITSNGTALEWTMSLALSDPMLSGLALRWVDVRAGLTWANMNQTVQWRDATDAQSLEAA